MKPGKVLTILTIALLALFLTGCGPTLEEKINEEMVKPYTGQEFSIRCKGPLEGPFASSGSRGISGTIDNELSFSLGATNAETGYGKEPYTGPIQYEVTVTIGDDITETLIVGTEGTDSSK